MSHKPAHLLLVDDDPGLLKLLGLRLTSEGYSVVTAESGAEGLRVLNREKVDLVISDLRMDEMDGMQLFAEIQKVQPGMPVIILTAHGSIPDAVAATQQGVFSFLTKPVDKDALYQAIDDALEQSAPATDERWREAIVTRSPLMLRLLEQARLVAQSDVSVLINGQSGTGKEIFAQAIHNASPRNSKPFIAINCGALPEQLLESELFGHARGAFTGAVSNREGLFQAAEGGTLFLDEIGDMPAPLQVKLLRVLQERKVRPLGSNRDIDIDVRIISATHRDLPKAMTRGEFREDLYYRLNVVSLKIPALAERTEDIPLLANHLLRQAAERHKPFVRAFSTDAMKRLMTASWPGNVRQLVNVIEQLIGRDNSVELRTNCLTGRFEVGRYLGKKLLIGRDVPSDFLQRAGAQKLKSLTGNDTLTAEFKGENSIEVVIGEFNVIIVSNSRLLLRFESDEGAWRRRLLVINYERPPLPTEKRIDQFDKVLMATEGSGILNFALAGAAELLSQNRQIQRSEEQMKKAESLLMSSDPVSYFISNYVELDPDSNLTVELMVRKFRDFSQSCKWPLASERKIQSRIKEMMFELYGIMQSKNISYEGRAVRGYIGCRFVKKNHA